MKKSIVLSICLFIGMMAAAQEKKGGFALELGYGASTFGNYSALSAFEDHTERHTAISAEHISAGYHHPNGYFIGMTANIEQGKTSMIQLGETFTNLYAMIDIRNYYKLGEKISLESGVAYGLLIRLNTFNDNNDPNSISTSTRYGMGGHFATGLHYAISEDCTIGVRVLFPQSGILFGEAKRELHGLDPNSQNHLAGHSVQLNVFKRF